MVESIKLMTNTYLKVIIRFLLINNLLLMGCSSENGKTSTHIEKRNPNSIVTSVHSDSNRLQKEDSTIINIQDSETTINEVNKGWHELIVDKELKIQLKSDPNSFIVFEKECFVDENGEIPKNVKYQITDVSTIDEMLTNELHTNLHEEGKLLESKFMFNIHVKSIDGKSLKVRADKGVYYCRKDEKEGFNLYQLNDDQWELQSDLISVLPISILSNKVNDCLSIKTGMLIDTLYIWALNCSMDRVRAFSSIAVDYNEYISNLQGKLLCLTDYFYWNRSGILSSCITQLLVDQMFFKEVDFSGFNLDYFIKPYITNDEFSEADKEFLKRVSEYLSFRNKNKIGPKSLPTTNQRAYYVTKSPFGFTLKAIARLKKDLEKNPEREVDAVLYDKLNFYDLKREISAQDIEGVDLPEFKMLNFINVYNSVLKDNYKMDDYIYSKIPINVWCNSDKLIKFKKIEVNISPEFSDFTFYATSDSVKYLYRLQGKEIPDISSKLYAFKKLGDDLLVWDKSDFGNISLERAKVSSL